MSNEHTARPEVPDVGLCQSYAPGHQVHWIMASKCRSEQRVDAGILQVQGTAITVEFAGHQSVWYHHEPERLRTAIALYPWGVQVIEERTCIALRRSGSATYWFSCSKEPLGECNLIEGQ